MTWTKRQVVSGNNGATATTTVSATLTGTQIGSVLIAIVCGAVNGITITAPAGWKTPLAVTSTTPSGGSVQIFYFPNNPGGITSVQFTFGAAALGSCMLWEFSSDNPLLNSAGSILDLAFALIDANGTALGSGPNKSLQSYEEIIVGGFGYVNATAITISGLTAGYVDDGGNIGTAAAGNGGVHGFSSIENNTELGFFAVGATLSAIPTAGPTIVVLSFTDGDIQSSNGNIGPVNNLPGGAI